MAPNAGNMKTRVCIVSDTHDQSPSPTCRFFNTPLPTADVLIHAGDLTNTGKHAELAECLAWLRAAPAALKLVIPGNHDITLDNAYYPTRQWQHRSPQHRQDPAACRALFETAATLPAGVVYLEEGTHRFRLENGALLTVYASGYTPAFCNWAFAYPRDEDRFNKDDDDVEAETAASRELHLLPANPVPTDGVDILITHGPPHGVLDRTLRGDHAGCQHLRRAVARARPQVHCFGHIHEGYGAVFADWAKSGTEQMRPIVPEQHVPLSSVDITGSSVKEEGATVTKAEDVLGRRFEAGRDTLLLNAAIMDMSYVPYNAPWVVDMDLPSAG